MMTQQYSYKNFIILGFTLTLLYELCFFVMRVSLAYSTFDDFSLTEYRFLPMFKMGFILDMRAICIVFAVVLLLGYIASISKLFWTFAYKFTLVFTTLASFLIVISALVNFYYFETYHTKIDTFIFGLKDDDTMAILKIVWEDYPALIVLLASIVFAFLCFKCSQKILNIRWTNRALGRGRFTFIRTLMLNLALIALVFIGIRGSVGTFPLREDEHHISTNPLINHIATNPIIAFSWAYSHYKRQDNFHPVDLKDIQSLENKLFPIFKTNSQKHIQQQPNVVVVLMESFGSNLLMLDSQKDFDLLMSFRKHFEQGKIKHNAQVDFTFVNFLSSQNGTAGSFASLFFLSPSANISLSNAKNKTLPLTPFQIYKKAGYEVVYITSGNRSWQNFGDYITTLGANAVYDSNFLLKHYPQSEDSQNVYGVGDEFAYQFALELLQKTEKPIFIVILTTSNHPPYALPRNFIPPKYHLESKMSFFRQDDINKVRMSVNVFGYASNAFGEFIQNIKESSFKDKTIVAMSGDHIYRDLKAYDNVALNHAVPLYLYIPQIYTKDFKERNFSFEPSVLGSHKDIFPTLYALSLNECEFLTLGGRNLFDTKADQRYHFAYNSSVWIDKDGIYPRGANTGFFYIDKAKKKFFFVNSNDKQNFQLSPQKAEFFENYDKLDWLQLNYRLFGFANSNF